MSGRRWALCAAAVMAFGLVPHRAVAADTPPDTVPLPQATHLSYLYDAFEQGVARPATRALDLALLVRKLQGHPREAFNLDERDRVRLPSTWWQPRVGYHPVGVEDLRTGPGPGDGPAPGRWKVVSAKTEGVSKGFQVVDSAGVRFAIKFDVPLCPELGSSADVVVSRLYWAAGYNVPDNTIAFFRREDLAIGKNATYKVAGQKRPITDAFIDELLRDVPKQADESYRVVASRFLKGKPLGEWLYDGRRKDDPEDLIPHELRREIRGLWAINAWVNHTDCSARNNLDMYVTDGGRSFVRHHLIDFSGCLGSASIAEQSMRSGHEYFFDYGAIAQSFLTLGLPRLEWESAEVPHLVGVGFVESRTFDAGAWRPYLPNPALDQRTERDIRWGARIVAAFSDDLIQFAVDCGRYSDPRTAEYLARILRERRDKIAARWLTAKDLTEAR